MKITVSFTLNHMYLYEDNITVKNDYTENINESICIGKSSWNGDKEDKLRQEA